VKSEYGFGSESSRKPTNLQLYSSSISVGFYFLLNTFVILYQIFLSRQTVSDFSVLICDDVTDFKSEHEGNLFQIFFNSFPAIKLVTNSSRKVIVRLCRENEHSLDILLNVIIPVLSVSLIVKIIADLTLHKLSIYENLMKFTRFVGLKTFNAIHVIENPKKFKNNRELLQFLSRNVLSLNSQDPLTGETIMHVAEDLMSIDDILMLYKKGAKIDIEDFSGKTAKDCWSVRTLQRFDGETQEEEEAVASLEHHLNHLQKLATNECSILFSFLILIGFKPGAKNNSGRSVLDLIAEKLISDCQSGLPFLICISYDDIHKIMLSIMMRLDLKEKINLTSQIFKFLNSQNILLRKLKCLRSSPFVRVLFQQKASQAGDAAINDFLRLYLTNTEVYETPLHHACAKGEVNIAKIILSSNIDPNVLGKNQETPLHLSCQGCHPDCVKLLLKHKCDPNLQDKQGNSALLVACQKGDDESVKLLMEFKADPNICNKKYQTPLHLACRNELSDCDQILLDSEANPNAKDLSGRVPLHYASEKGNMKSVELLLEFKASPNVQDNKQMTPSDLAKRKNHLDCLRILTNYIKNSTIEQKIKDPESSSRPESCEDPNQLRKISTNCAEELL